MPVRIYDISRPLSPELAVWPGDTPFSLQHVMQKSRGDSVNLSTLIMSAHTGAHADAPYHFDDAGPKIDQLSLDTYIGPARVVHHDQLGPVTFQHVKLWSLTGVERLLVRTPTSEQPHELWPEETAYLLPDTVDELGKLGIRLIGIDSPSVDHLDSKDLPAHHALARNQIAILENLYLQNVPPGDYELIALPLRIAADGSPVRAVLRA